MSNYYAMRDAKVRIAHELMNRGWEVLGYHADESDSMTDYYSPANWGGIATKNGFVLVIDNNTAAESTPIKKWNPEASLSHDDLQKIKKLEALTQDRGATAGEEANAKALIERIKSNISKDAEQYTIVGYTVTHMANPGKCKWHIEKDGSLYDKGTGITKYSDVPSEWRFDINTMQYKDSYKYYSIWENGELVRKENTITDEERKIINDFKALILRWERIVNGLNTMGDGTTETEEAGLEQAENSKMEKVIEKVTKKILKMFEVTDRKNIKVGDYITVSHHGGYWKVTSEYMQKGTWKGVADSRKAFTYEVVGAASRGYQQLKNPQSYYNYEYRMLKDIEAGSTKIFELKEVEEVQEIEKWVKVETKKAEPKKTVKKETAKAETVKEENSNSTITESNVNIGEFTINEDTDTRDNSKLWIVKLSNRVSKEEYIRINNIIKSLGGYYSKFKSGFLFKFDPSVILGVKQEETPAQEVAAEQQPENRPQEENPYNPTFKEGYIYNVHFKEWSMSIEDIKTELNSMNIYYTDMGDKVGFESLTYSEILKVKELSDRNGSILFKDSEITESEYNIIESLIDYSTSLVCEMDIAKTDWSINEEFKNKFADMLKYKNITTITLNALNYLQEINYTKLVKVLIDLLQNPENENSKNEYNSEAETDQQTESISNNHNKKDYSKLIERINSQLETNNKKINHLSGDYKTNTWKRMNEQANRDNQRQALQKDNSILNYLLDKIDNNTITEFEVSLTIGTFRSDMKQYSNRKVLEYPNPYKSNLAQWARDEYIKDVKRLQRYNINNLEQLIQAVQEYKNIIEQLNKNTSIDPKTEQIKKLEREYKLQQKGDFHCTNNKELLNKLMELADIQQGERVLEPSAGLGHIVDRIKEYTNNIDVCEYMYSYADLLKLKGYNVKANDFLSYSNYNSYDKIVANVPFSDEQNHVKHIYKCLKAGGRAVIITSNSWTFKSDKQSQDFRNWLNDLTHEVYDIEQGLFEFTNVSCRILVIYKEAETREEAI